MSILNKTEIQYKQEKEKKQEHKHLGSTVKRRGLKIFALNTDTMGIYEIVPERRVVFDVSKGSEKASFKATVNPEHPACFKLNKKNAVKYFKKLGYDC